jgi:hypothetical protein
VGTTLSSTSSMTIGARGGELALIVNADVQPDL